MKIDRGELIELAIDEETDRLMRYPDELLQWLAWEDSGLTEIRVTHPKTGEKLDADTALLTYAAEDCRWVLWDIRDYVRKHESMRQQCTKRVDNPESDYD